MHNTDFVNNNMSNASINQDLVNKSLQGKIVNEKKEEKNFSPKKIKDEGNEEIFKPYKLGAKNSFEEKNNLINFIDREFNSINDILQNEIDNRKNYNPSKENPEVSKQKEKKFIQIPTEDERIKHLGDYMLGDT